MKEFTRGTMFSGLPNLRLVQLDFAANGRSCLPSHFRTRRNTTGNLTEIETSRKQYLKFCLLTSCWEWTWTYPRNITCSTSFPGSQPKSQGRGHENIVNYMMRTRCSSLFRTTIGFSWCRVSESTSYHSEVKLFIVNFLSFRDFFILLMI